MNTQELTELLELRPDEVTAHSLIETVRRLNKENDELKATVRSFFEDFLNVREESDSGRVFAPITISSCRVMMTEPLGNLLNKMRELSGAKPAPKSEASK
jgi:hypothetical protein